MDKLLETGTEMNVTEKIRLLTDVALGMCWLHGSNPIIIHRDLKPGNILVCESLGYCLTCVVNRGYDSEGWRSWLEHYSQQDQNQVLWRRIGMENTVAYLLTASVPLDGSRSSRQ